MLAGEDGESSSQAGDREATLGVCVWGGAEGSAPNQPQPQPQHRLAAIPARSRPRMDGPRWASEAEMQACVAVCCAHHRLLGVGHVKVPRRGGAAGRMAMPWHVQWFKGLERASLRKLVLTEPFSGLRGHLPHVVLDSLSRCPQGAELELLWARCTRVDLERLLQARPLLTHLAVGSALTDSPGWRPGPGLSR
jgi:hypothetical protein